MSDLRTGGQVIADHLVANGVPYVMGIPGHGSLPMVDAFVGRDSPVFLQVRHEQAAAHLADAYFRVARKPLAVMTSIGPGAVNTAVGIATAYVDSSSMIVFTGDVHTYMFGRGVLQEIDRKAWADLTTVFEPITKRLWQVTRVDQLARILPQAFALAAGGRPGPVLISVPMDVQADAADVPAARPVDLPEPPAPAAGAVSQIRAALADAERPVLLAGGGVVQSGASARFRQIAEHLGMPVVATYQAKGVLPEDHPLYGRYPGSKGTDTGNALCREADIILAIGCRFADEATSSYVPGVTFSIPPTRLYQVDIDEYDIGKNYPVELGVVADAAAFCEALWTEIRDEARRATWEQRIADLVVPWNARLAPGRSDRSLPLRISAVLDIVHGTVPTDTIVLTGAGHSQAQFLQEHTVNDASQVISPNGFSTMGFRLPGAIGARLAAPDRPVLGFAGDGDFLNDRAAAGHGRAVRSRRHLRRRRQRWLAIHPRSAAGRLRRGARLRGRVPHAQGRVHHAGPGHGRPWLRRRVHRGDRRTGAQGRHRQGARLRRADGHRRARPTRAPGVGGAGQRLVGCPRAGLTAGTPRDLRKGGGTRPKRCCQAKLMGTTSGDVTQEDRR